MITHDLEVGAATRTDHPRRRRSDREFSRILVPVDGSAHSEQPLPLALAIARAAGADLQLVWVRSPGARPLAATGSTRLAHLEALTEAVGDRLDAPTYRTVLTGGAADAIVRHASDANIGLIVMATRGHGGLWRLGLGSTTDAVLHTSPVPVLVVRAPHEEEPDLDRAVRIDDIVVALDGSEPAESALDPALELARLCGARITLLRIVEPGGLPLDYGGFGVDLSRESLAIEEREAHEYLDRVAARLAARSLPAHTAVRDAPTAAVGILRFAREADADVVAIASRGAGSALSLSRGRTAAGLLSAADVPLLVAPPGRRASAR